jgi:hypothetical protein
MARIVISLVPSESDHPSYHLFRVYLNVRINFVRSKVRTGKPLVSRVVKGLVRTLVRTLMIDIVGWRGNAEFSGYADPSTFFGG